MSNAASSNSTQNVSVNVSSVKQNANARHSNVCQRSNARRSVYLRSARCVIPVKRPENARFCGENIVFYKPSGRRMRGIAKILSHTVDTFLLRRCVAYVAHHFAFTFLNFEKRKLIVWNSVLKIRVSVVRFRPRPPYTNARLLSVGRFHLGFPQYTPGTGAFCVCHRVVTAGAHFGQFDSFLPSVLCKETPTLSPQHTHIALCDKDLYVCRFFEFARPFGGADD